MRMCTRKDVYGLGSAVTSDDAEIISFPPPGKYYVLLCFTFRMEAVKVVQNTKPVKLSIVKYLSFIRKVVFRCVKNNHVYKRL